MPWRSGKWKRLPPSSWLIWKPCGLLAVASRSPRGSACRAYMRSLARCLTLASRAAAVRHTSLVGIVAPLTLYHPLPLDSPLLSRLLRIAHHLPPCCPLCPLTGHCCSIPCCDLHPPPLPDPNLILHKNQGGQKTRIPIPWLRGPCATSRRARS